MNCLHCETGLCPECQADYDTDSQAWLEYGQHAEGDQAVGRVYG